MPIKVFRNFAETSLTGSAIMSEMGQFRFLSYPFKFILCNHRVLVLSFKSAEMCVRKQSLDIRLTNICFPTSLLYLKFIRVTISVGTSINAKFVMF